MSAATRPVRLAVSEAASTQIPKSSEFEYFTERSRALRRQTKVLNGASSGMEALAAVILKTVQKSRWTLHGLPFPPPLGAAGSAAARFSTPASSASHLLPLFLNFLQDSQQRNASRSNLDVIQHAEQLGDP
jgi:hypothetical protein